MDRNPRPRGRNQWAKTQKYAVHNYVTVPQVEEDTPPKTAEEVIKRNLKNWPWGQTVPRKLLTLVSSSLLSGISILHLVQGDGNAERPTGSISPQ